MRVGLISDSHGNIYALDAALVELDRLGVDAILCNGDVAFGLVRPAETVDRVRERGIPCVRGNTEDFCADISRLTNAGPDWAATGAWFMEAIGDERAQWLAGLPLRHMALDGAVLQFHGTPLDNEASLLHAELRPLTERKPADQAALLRDYPQPVVTFGHTHLPGVHRLGVRWLINPGSLSNQLWTGDPRARFALLEGEGDQWTATLHAVEYNHERAARVAESLGLPQSAGAAYQLRHGRPPSA